MADAAVLRQKYHDELQKVDGIEVEALPLYPYMTTGIKTSLPVLFQIKVGDFSAQVQRQPVHVCLLVDRSGSMSGAPLKGCKEAVRRVVQQLESVDLVSLVMYDDHVATVFERETVDACDKLFVAIDRITAGGMTDISQGLEAAVACLNGDPAGDYQKIVFLFSDGNANCGITCLDKLGTHINRYVKEHNVQITSFGIGSDYNETWMRAIARAGKGNYFFISDMGKIPETVERGLSGFTSVVTKNTVLRMRGLEGHTLTEVQSLSDHRVLTTGYSINTMRSLGLYQVLALVNVNKNPDLVGTSVSNILEYELSFTPVDKELGLEAQCGMVSLRYTNDPALLAQKNPKALCHITMLECVPLDAKVDAALAKGNVKEAISMKREIIKKYEGVLEHDTFGFISSMLLRAKTAIEMMEKHGASETTCKHQGHTTLWCQKAAKTRQKQDWEADLSDDDEDMGYGLLD